MNDGSGRGHHFREGDVCGVCHKPWPCCSDGWSHRGSQVCERCGISLVFLPPDEAATDAAAWPEHVVVDASERDAHEQRWGMTYCRRCGRPVVNDRYPDKITKRPCEVVKVSLR